MEPLEANSPVKRRRNGASEEGEGDDVDLDGGERSGEEDGGDGGYGEDWIIDDDEEGGAFGGMNGKGKSAVERWGGGGKGGREVGESSFFFVRLRRGCS